MKYSTGTEVNQDQTIDAKQVPLELDKIGMLLETLDKSLVCLQNELSPVLTDLVREDDTGATKDPQPHVVPLAGILRERSGHIETLIRQVDYLRGGLQI